MPDEPLAGKEIPLLEYDPGPAVIEPHIAQSQVPFPERCVMCFFAEQIEALVQAGQAQLLASFQSEIGPHPVYLLRRDGEEIALMHPGVGAPLSAGLLEELIVSGGRKIIVCGGCGVLQHEIVVGHLLVVDDAVRDEGTSYHYLPPSRRVAADEQATEAIRRTLEEEQIPYLRVTTWTTDAFYRETPAKVQLRREEGCLCVEMEAAALFAVAQFRGVSLGQLLYAGDDVSGTVWDSRRWHLRGEARASVLELALRACSRL